VVYACANLKNFGSCCAIFDFFVQKWSKLVKHILDHKAAEKLNSKNSKDFLESKRYLLS